MIYFNPVAQKTTPIASWSNVQATTTNLIPYQPSLKFEDPYVPFISRGAGRSFGDAAYITNGTTFTSQLLCHIHSLDLEHGFVVCESGVSVGELHSYLDATEWTFPVYGGTQWVTVGGAIASDIHGKNDVHQGSFGNHVQSIILITPDGQERECSRQVAPDLFQATIGGMGLTGLIKTATLKLQQDLPRTLRLRSQPIFNIDDAIDCFNRYKSEFQFCTLISCTPRLTKGLFFFASYEEGQCNKFYRASEIQLPAIKLFNKFFIQATSQLVYLCNCNLDKMIHVMNFNYIGVHERFKYWNNFYKPSGFIEYHFVVSEEHIKYAFETLVNMCHKREMVFFFGVLKRFGAIRREGLLSFPKQGYTMNFQMENRAETRKFILDFTDFLLEIKGRVYLAKDACVLPRQFEGMYEELSEWQRIVLKHDPTNKIQSDLSKRLGLKPW